MPFKKYLKISISQDANPLHLAAPITKSNLNEKLVLVFSSMYNAHILLER